MLPVRDAHMNLQLTKLHISLFVRTKCGTAVALAHIQEIVDIYQEYTGYALAQSKHVYVRVRMGTHNQWYFFGFFVTGHWPTGRP